MKINYRGAVASSKMKKNLSTILVAGAVFMSGFVMNVDAAPRTSLQKKKDNASSKDFFKKLFTPPENGSSTSRNSSSVRKPLFTTSSSNRPATRRPTSSISSGVRVRHMVLASSSKSSTRVVIDIGKQKAYLLSNGKVAITTPVSTARRGKRTPRGTFRMSQRIRTGKISTIYGVEMPYWMRLSGTAYGVHAGYLPGYPASAGCIRLPASAAQLIYDHTKGGTRVSIHSSWKGF